MRAGVVDKRINPPPRRPLVAPTTPASPPAVVATFVVAFSVQRAEALFCEAKKQLTREGCTHQEALDTLCANGSVDIGECLCTLLRPVVSRIEKSSRCPAVTQGEVYIEPAPTETPDD